MSFPEHVAAAVRQQMLAPEFQTLANGGRIFWVKDSAATDFAKFVREHPPYEDGIAAVYTTMRLAAAACSADRPDEVRVCAGHTEELESVLSLGVAGVNWIGLGKGTKKPVITVSGAIHGIALEGAGVVFKNFRFAAPPIDEALSMIRIKGAGVTVEDIDGIASGTAGNFVDCIRIVAGANDLTLNKVKLVSGAGSVPNSFLSFEGAISRFASAGFYATGSVGTAGVIDAANARQKQSVIQDWRVAVGGAAKPALTLDTAKSEGIVFNCFFAGTHTTLANNGQFVGDWRLSDVKLLEETGNGAQGAVIPAVDSD